MTALAYPTSALARSSFELGWAYAHMISELSTPARLDCPAAKRELMVAQVSFFTHERTQAAVWKLVDRALHEDPTAPLTIGEIAAGLDLASWHGWYRPAGPDQAWDTGVIAYGRLLDQLPEVPDLLRPGKA